MVGGNRSLINPSPSPSNQMLCPHKTSSNVRTNLNQDAEWQLEFPAHVDLSDNAHRNSAPLGTTSACVDKAPSLRTNSQDSCVAHRMNSPLLQVRMHLAVACVRFPGFFLCHTQCVVQDCLRALLSLSPSNGDLRTKYTILDSWSEKLMASIMTGFDDWNLQIVPNTIERFSTTQPANLCIIKPLCTAQNSTSLFIKRRPRPFTHDFLE